jgi:hypothetical protein
VERAAAAAAFDVRRYAHGNACACGGRTGSPMCCGVCSGAGCNGLVCGRNLAAQGGVSKPMGMLKKQTNKLPTTRAKPLPKHRPTTTQAATRSRSLLSRSRVSRAVEAARRVGGRLIVAAAHSVSGLRAGAGTPADAGSECPAGREGDRRAEQNCTLRSAYGSIGHDVGQYSSVS